MIVQSLGCLLYALMFFRSPFDMVYAKGDSVALAVAGASRQTIVVPSDSPCVLPRSVAHARYPSALVDLVFEMMQMEYVERPHVDGVLLSVREVDEQRVAQLPNVA